MTKTIWILALSQSFDGKVVIAFDDYETARDYAESQTGITRELYTNGVFCGIDEQDNQKWSLKEIVHRP